MSSFVGEPAVAHSMPSNYSHINIGEPNSGLPVDRWHIDSVDFVLICLLSDPEGMEGGELQVVAEHEPEQGLFVSLTDLQLHVSDALLSIPSLQIKP